MKYFQLQILTILAFLLLKVSTNAYSESVVIWSEDFTGYFSLPEQGKNATYEYKGKTNSGAYNYCELLYPSAIGKLAPGLRISLGYYFKATISLYGASGDFTLTFSANNYNNVSVSSDDKKVKVVGSGKKYTVNVPEGKETISLIFTAKNANIRIDDFLLFAPSSCRKNYKEPPISFGVESASTVLGEPFDAPLLSNPDNLEVKFWTSDQTIAKVDDEGKVTPISLGTDTISAIFTGNDTYGYKEAKYILNVTRRISDGEVYFEDFSKCMSLGGHYGKEGEFSGSAFFDNSHSSGQVRSAYKCAYLEYNGKGHSSDYDYIISNIEELEGKNGILSFLAKGQIKDTSAIYVSVAGGGFIVQQRWPIKYGQWELVSIPFNGATAKTTFTLIANKAYIDSVSIVVIPKNVQVKISKVGYASLYYSKYNLRVPVGMSAYTMRVNDEDKLVTSHRYVAGEVIPHSTGIILKAVPGNYYFEVTEEEGFSDPLNQLRGSDYKKLTTGGTIYYMLAAKDDKAGFYWAANGGAAFQSAAHKAYLALPSKLNAKSSSGYPFNFDDETTGIESSFSAKSNREDSYNLLGQKINADAFRGIIIKKGRKIIKQ